MAEAILFNIAHSLLTNLGSTALDEIASAWGFKRRLEKLRNTINTIKDMLLDAEERQFKSHALRGWLDRLKIALYAADDLFDEFSTMVSTWEVVGGSNLSREVINIFSHSNRIALAFNISKKIKKIREELDDIVKDSSEFAFILPIREEGRLTGHLKNQSHSFIDVEEVIGLDDDREAIIDILMASQEPRLSIIAIVGLGGMGKKTLAQLIYNDERVSDLFEIKLWVCVSEIFDIKEVIKKILMSATNNESQNLDIDQLLQRLKIAIGGKKYLLVMEDVWSEKHEDWSNLRAILKGGADGSKILMTTRSRSVADIGGNVQVYELHGLSEEMSWALFEKMAFEAGESTKKPQLVKLGKEIVNKCAKVPLALRTLGSLLRGNEEWKWISIAGASFAELPDIQNDVLAILKLSYHHLSPPLKNCFAYFALFPKGYKFEREKLVDLWIAEGFVIPANKTQSSIDLGNEYVMQLLQKCFFQNITKDEWGNISGFKMHHLIHDLALQVAGTECKMAQFKDRDFSDRIRHLSFGYHLTGLWEIPSGILKTKLLRTFLMPTQCKDGSNFNKAKLEQIISNFRCLRVLDLCKLGVRILPKSIGKLIHLRYLDLSMNPIEELPHSITRIHNLQTLILYHCQRLRALPIHIRKLSNLMSLNVSGCLSLTHMPPGLGELTSLHNLPYFIVKCSSSTRCMPNLVTTTTAQLRDLKTLNNLRGSLEMKLSEYLEDPASEAKEANLSSKPGLTELVIRLGVDSDPNFNPQTSHHDEILLKGLEPHPNLKKLTICEYRGQKLPSWTTDNLCMSLPDLVHICLQHCLRCRQVPSFSQLLYLRCLSLVRLDNVEYMETSLHGLQSSPPPPSKVTFFPSLKELELKGMGNLKGWWEVTQVIDCNIQEKMSVSFSDLNILRIIDCPNLTTVPLSPNVEEIVLINVHKDLTVLKKLTSSAVSGDVGYSSKLKKLSVDEIEDLISLPEECLGYITSLEILDRNMLNTSRLEEVFKCLSSLRCLKFTNCENLTSIFEGLEHLSSLNSLLLENCKELDLSMDDQRMDSMPWKALKDLVRYV